MSDWNEVTDKTTGKTYYYNKTTKVTQWHRPADMPAAPGGATTPATTTGASGTDPESVAANWAAVVDPSTQRTYFYNKVTKKTSWTKPACMDGGATAPTAAAAPAAATPAAAASTTTTTPAAGDKNAPENWNEAKDPTTGRSYWFNKVTKETTWKNPKETTTTPAPAATPAPAPAATPAPQVAAAAPAPAPSNPNPAAPAPTPAPTPASPTPTPAVATPVSPLLTPSSPTSAAAPAPLLSQPSAANLDKKEEDGKALELQGEDSDDDSSKKKDPNKKKKAGSDDDEEETHEFKFAKHRHGLINRIFKLGNPHDEKKILTWKKSMIKKALLKQNRDLDAEAVQNFKNVMSYMGDRKSSKKEMDHAKKMLTNLMIAPSGLRDEVFIQLCKQTTENPKIESTVKGWELMVYCLATFPPSKPLKNFLQDFINKNIKDDTRPQVQSLAKNCNERMPIISKLGQRKQVPSRLELDCLKQMKPVPIKVRLISGEEKSFNVDSYTTVADVQAMMAKALQLTCDTPFALYESAGPNVERILDQKDRVLDTLASWENYDKEEKDRKEAEAKEKEKNKNAKVNSARPKFCEFLYKAKLVLKTNDPDVMADPAAINLIYQQAVHDVVTSRYPVNEKDITVLAALQLQAQYGNYREDVCKESWFLDKLDSIMPDTLLLKKGSKKKDDKVCKEWAQKIQTKYAKVANFTTNEARLNYLDYVQEWVFYGATFFSVEQRQFKDYPSPLTLGITCEGALLMHPEKRTVLENYAYTDIVTWGHSDEKFIVVVGNIVQQRKLIFKSNDGKIMNHLIHDYVKFKVKQKPVLPGAPAPPGASGF